MTATALSELSAGLANGTTTLGRYFEQVAAEDFPMTESGKVHRATLAQLFVEKGAT